MKSESHEYLSLNVPSIPHSTLLLRHHSNRKKAEEILGLNATLGAPKDFLLTLEKNPKCSSRILLVSNVPEKNDFLSSSFSLFSFCVFFFIFGSAKSELAWNHNFPMKPNEKTWKSRDEWHCTRHMAYDCFYVVLLPEFIEPCLPLKKNRFFSVYSCLSLCCLVEASKLFACFAMTEKKSNTTKKRWRIC